MKSPYHDVLLQVHAKFPCRQAQVEQLFALLANTYSSPPSIVLHGVEATGKTSVIKEVLSLSNLPHAVVQSRECITGRHLLEQTLTATVEAITTFYDDKVDRNRYARCESLSALSVHLQNLLREREKFVLVFDGIDNQRDAPSTLLPALTRLNEIIPNLTTILVVAFPREGSLRRPGIPHIHFPPYTREETLRIICTSPPPIFTEPISHSPEYPESLQLEDREWLWTRFCAAVWDSLGKTASRDLLSFRRLAFKLWHPFVASVVDGTFGPRDFSRLMVAKRSLFQNESSLLDKLPPAAPSYPPPQTTQLTTNNHHDLPTPAKHLLIAAYLASYNPARTDAVFFMKYSDKKKRRAKSSAARGRPPKHRRIPRHHLAPAPFPLDRLLAIHASISSADAAPRQPGADLYTQLATLTALRLLVRSGGESADALDPGAARWRVNVGWEFVRRVGRSVGIEVGELVAP